MSFYGAKGTRTPNIQAAADGRVVPEIVRPRTPGQPGSLLPDP